MNRHRSCSARIGPAAIAILRAQKKLFSLPTQAREQPQATSEPFVPAITRGIWGIRLTTVARPSGYPPINR